MRTLRLIIGLFFGAGAFVTPASGADARPQATVRVDVQMVSVSVADSFELIPALRDANTVEKGWTRLQQMLAQERATLIDWPVLWLEAGGRAVSENIEEMRYPTEFDPPQQPQTFGVSPPKKPVLRPQWDEAFPNAFETRNTGSSIEAEATVEEDGRIISLNFVGLCVNLAGFQKWRCQPYPLGGGGVVMTPNFLTSKVTTSLRVHHDRPVLVGVFVVAKPKPHVKLYVLRAKATPLPPAAAAAGAP